MGIISWDKKNQRLSGVLGAIVGDYVGSRFEFNNHKSKVFEFFHDQCFFTDDTVMTLAIAQALYEIQDEEINEIEMTDKLIFYMQKLGRKYENAGYGGRFIGWLRAKNPVPYMSLGNGSAMRVSSVPYFYKGTELVEKVAKITAKISHNHPEGIKGAVCTAILMELAYQGATKEEIKNMAKQYYYVDFSLDEIRDEYKFDETCEGTIPYSIVAFLESDGFEDAIRNAISIGGDSDTLACITGAIAGAYYGVPNNIRKIIKESLKGYPDLDKIIEKLEI